MTEFGHLLEILVVGELLKEVSWTEEIAAFVHWRTRATWKSISSWGPRTGA